MKHHWLDCKSKKPYIGQEILEQQKEKGVDKKLVAITLTKRNIARHDYPVVDGDEVIGKVTSGTWSPSFINTNCTLHMFLLNCLELVQN